MEPPSFKQATDEMNGMNDDYADFIHKHLIITNDENDYITKTEMYKIFKDMFQNKHVTPQILLSQKGCYIGVIKKRKL